MEQKSVKNFRFRFLVILLAFIAIISIITIIALTNKLMPKEILIMEPEYYFECQIGNILLLVSAVVFLVYTVFFHNKVKMPILMTVSIVFLAIGLSLTEGLAYYFFLFRGFAGMILFLPVFICFGFSVKDIMHGLIKKKMTIISLALAVTFSILPSTIFAIIRLIDSIGYYRYGTESLIHILSGIIGPWALCLAVFIFSIANRLPPILSRKERKVVNGEISLEQQLQTLQYKYETGIIGTEEYTKKRADIISKL